MLTRICWLVLYWLTWAVWLELNRVVFLSYQLLKGPTHDTRLWPDILWHGLRMDLSVAAYVSLIPGLALAFLPSRWLLSFFSRYTALMLILVSFMTTVDMEMYRTWGFRLDTTPLRYLKTPTEALASVSSSPLGWLCGLLVGLIVGGILLFGRVNHLASVLLRPAPRWSFVPLTLATALLIIPIRGGLQLAPMNVSAVFFSPIAFANHAAINPQWNFLFSVLENADDQTNPFGNIPEPVANQIVQALYRQTGGDSLPSTKGISSGYVLTQQRPNVLLIVWESLTAKVVSRVGGRTGVTPQFDRLCNEGLLFTNYYASGDRSEKGLVALLSGFPAQPTTSIMTVPQKSAKLPTLAGTLKHEEYQTAFYYGGETEFANIRSYLFHSQYDRIISKPDFPPETWNSKWGAHDHVVYNRLLADLSEQKAPFFTTFFTLSSHEPFEVPMPTAVPGTDEENLFLNAHYYADKSLGEFIAQAKKQPWWANTLVIIVADHGHRMPIMGQNKTEEFHIPMLWLGGALRQPGVVSQIASQTDLPATLLQQLGVSAGAFRWSSNLLDPARQPFAYFAFQNGFGFVRPGRALVYDNDAQRIVEQYGTVSDADLRAGLAFEEVSFGDYLAK
ncbi:MAG: alkaline phosphatase family protein [Cytophagales bacterium]|nr:MAG: alkaline phosphatase family protein [Cytophagales bacterium]